MKVIPLAFLVISILLPVFRGAAAEKTGEKEVEIKITSGNTVITATLNNSSASKDFIKKLPLTLNLYFHQNREYYTDIRLDKNDQTQNGYTIGDIAYWTPGNSLVFFYNEGYTGNLIIMGKIKSGLKELPKIGKNPKVKIEIVS